MSETLSALTYVSESLLLPGLDQRSEFMAIVDSSRRNNRPLEITGALLFHEGMFLQVLEGSRTAVEALFATIRADARHTFVRHLGTELVKERRFGQWTMAFVNPGQVGSSFVGSSLSELRKREGTVASPVIDWMVDELNSAERSIADHAMMSARTRVSAR